MRNLKIVLVALIISVLAIPVASCVSESEVTSTPETQVVSVQQGNLTIDITAVGNLTLSLKEDLALEVSGTVQEPLTVEEVLVEEGDTVEEGQVLVTLDTTALEEKVTYGERALKTAELAVKSKEIDLQTAKDAEETIKSAEIDLETATNNYREITYPYTYSTFAFDIPAAITAIIDAQRQLTTAKEALEVGLTELTTLEYAEALYQLGEAEDDLINAQLRLLRGRGPELFIGDNTILATEDFWTLRAAELAMDKAEISLQEVKNSFQSGLDKAGVALDEARIALEEAREEVDTARDELEKAVVIAPFAGFVTEVNIEGGDEVKKGTVAVQLADPNKFEAEVMVSEMDIFQVKLGGDATVQIDAMPGLSLPAKVVHIAPTATIEAGVVNYIVEVEIQPLEAFMQEQQEAMQGAMQEISPGELSERLQQAIEEGSITQEQAEEMMKQWKQGQGGQQGQVPAVIPEDFQLREGLTVTVSILVDERSDVVLVPNAAITREGNRTYVQVVSPDGITEERAIQTGISNWQYTEVTDGLSEGEKVVVPQGTTTTPTTSTPGGPMPFIPHR